MSLRKFRNVVLPLATLCLLSGTGAAQDSEKQLLEDWENFTVYISKTKKSLADLQLQYNGAENSDTKKRIEGAFTRVRTAALARSKDFYKRLEGFILKNPDNIAVRQKRLDDTDFNNLSSRVRAEDAEKLFQLTGDGEYLHRAAEFHDKAYDFKTAAGFWKIAADKAASYQVLKELGESCLNSMDFAQAKLAFGKSTELATTQREKQEAQTNANMAGDYAIWWESERELRTKYTTQNDLPIVDMVTNRGTMVIELFEEEAPNTVANFIHLVEKGFYDNLQFFRNHAYFMIQGGDPGNDGRGGPGYRVKDEYDDPSARMHFPFTLSMANENRPNTNGSQFFVTSTTTHWLNNKHTVFGRLLDGFHVPQVQPVDPNDPQFKAGAFKIISAKVRRKRNHPYDPEKIETAR